MPNQVAVVPNTNSVAVMPPNSKPKPKVVLGKYQQANVFLNVDESSQFNRTGNNGITTQLWKFLLDLLTDYSKR